MMKQSSPDDLARLLTEIIERLEAMPPSPIALEALAYELGMSKADLVWLQTCYQIRGEPHD